MLGRGRRTRTRGFGQKSYADSRRRNLKFEVGDMVFLKVAPMKGVVRFERKGKLSPHFIGPFGRPSHPYTTCSMYRHFAST